MSTVEAQGFLASLSQQERDELATPRRGPNKREIFAWRDNTYGDIAFDIDKLSLAVAEGVIPYITSVQEIVPELVDYARCKGGVDDAYLAKMKFKDTRRPILTVLWDVGPMTTIIDGHHRIVKRYQAGANTMKIIQIPFHYWQPFSYWRARGQMMPELEPFFEGLSPRE